MKRQIRQLLGMTFLCAVLAIIGEPLQAQGFSYGSFLDDGNGNIETYVDYYEGGGSFCGPIVLSSTLNGVTVPVPEGETVYQEVNPTVPAVEYVFTVTIVVNVTGPYGGCEQFEDKLTATVTEFFTFYQNAKLIGTPPNQDCAWAQTACEAGTPTCTGVIVSPTPCDFYQGARWLVNSGNCVGFMLLPRDIGPRICS